ncbi:beta-L-arabinofuranosidase domain-containing protein [Paenibacillus sp. FSL H8-0537]|uniref:glycoside hydrolase family 127 protein n=1 Tax=Paenibacillus sp. FSL H8-0537 TaxID=2921399 RepID=UPI003100E7B4
MKSIKSAQSIKLTDVRIQDPLWSRYIDLVRDVVVPYQWMALNDQVEGAEPSHALRNFRIAAGHEQGEFYGMVFQDSDVAKWLEAVGYLLAAKPDPDLEILADGVIDVIAAAQQPDGYLNTYYTVKEPEMRWSNLCECHELYCAGHMIEAGVAYYQGTSKRKLLDVVCRLADYIDTVFGSEPGKLQGYDGHQEIELALVKLYRETGNEKYLNMSVYFLNERGRQPFYYDEEWVKRGRTHHWESSFMIEEKEYSQAHLPIREQDKAEGHAVRAVYMATGMADVAAETGDQSLLEACRRLWSNIVTRRMYITGGIGSMAQGEAFSLDYDLPNDTVYAETCASIGLIFFANRMLQIESNGEYADVMERALYNTVISGMSQDGTKFFYVNPLEVVPHTCGKNKNYNHVKPERQGWFGCACCPPNVARLLASLGDYIYTIRNNTIFTNLYIGGELECQLDEGHVVLKQQSHFPRDGAVRFEVQSEGVVPFTLALRLPNWCDHAQLRINGVQMEIEDKIINGYVHVSKHWMKGDIVEWDLSMPILRMEGHPLVRQTAGKVALQHGPFVYCMEEVDNGANLHQLALPKNGRLDLQYEDGLLGGIPTITAEAVRYTSSDWNGSLYRSEADWRLEPVRVTFIPYYAWANRGLGEMSVWVRQVNEAEIRKRFQGGGEIIE